MQNAREEVITFADLLVDAEVERRKVNLDTVCKYGIGILDKYMGWILPNELVVVGADTWMGKSEIAYKIAVTNAQRGKKVLLFALEWDLNEVALRYMQRTISELVPLKTIEFRFNRKQEHSEYVDHIIKSLDNEERVQNLLIFKKQQVPTMELLASMIEQMKDWVDMIIIDHLHYIQFASASQEIEEIGKVMRQVKQITDTIKKPIIIMSHLRKRKKTDDPTEQDLYWSSNIAKEANTIILLTRMENEHVEKLVDNWVQDDARYAWTKIIVEKSRTWLAVPTKFSTVYDLDRKDYVDELSEIILNESRAKKSDALSFDKIW